MGVHPGEPSAAGPVVAEAGAAAAAVVRAVARTAGEGPAAAQAGALADRLTRLADEDARAFEAARDALDAVDVGVRHARRDFMLGRLLDRAGRLPLEIAEACGDVAALARTFPDSADAESAALLAAGAARAAAHLVEVNLAVDDERLARARAAADVA